MIWNTAADQVRFTKISWMFDLIIEHENLTRFEQYNSYGDSLWNPVMIWDGGICVRYNKQIIFNYVHQIRLLVLETLVLKYLSLLTHGCPVTHTCVSKQAIIGSDNDLSPGRRQAIIWTNDELLLIETREQSSVKFELKFVHLHSRKCVWKCRMESGGHFDLASTC